MLIIFRETVGKFGFTNRVLRHFKLMAVHLMLFKTNVW